MRELPSCRTTFGRDGRRSRASRTRAPCHVRRERPGDERARRVVFSRLSGPARFVVVLLLLAAAAGSAPALELAERGKGGKGDDAWTDLKSGLAELRERRLPAVLWYPGSVLTTRARWEDTLSERRVERAFSRFIRIRLRADDLSAEYPPRGGDEREGPRDRRGDDVEKDGKRRGRRQDEGGGGDRGVPEPRGARRDDSPEGGGGVGAGGDKNGAGGDKDGAGGDKDEAGGEKGEKVGDRARALDGEPPKKDSPRVREVLRLPEGPEALLVLDFQERIVRRYSARTLPEPAALVRELGKIWRQNAFHARLAAKVEPLLAASRRAFGAKQVRKAVKTVLPLEDDDLQAKLDPVLRSRVQRLLQDYRAEAEKELREARRLFDEGKKTPNQAGVLFTKALRALDGAARDYPFPDVLKSVQREKAKILTYMTPGL